MQLLHRWMGTGIGDPGSHPCCGGGRGVPAHPGEHCRLLGAPLPASHIVSGQHAGCHRVSLMATATWLFGVPPPMLSCSCGLDTRPGADRVRGHRAAVLVTFPGLGCPGVS